MTLRYLAPAGSPIRVRDLGAWVSSMATVQDARQALARAVAERVQVPHVFLTCTGRAGLAILCRALARLGPASATEVIIPSYTCYSVPASIARAGLTPRLVDVDPDTLDYDRAALEATDGARVLAIVATNLYGHPNDLPWLAAWARARGCFLVDDAAQALGASVGGRASGTWGDAGLYSLDKGKNVSAIDGGVLVTGRHDVAAALQAELQALP